MVFNRIFGGFVFGMAVPMLVHENVYLTIATCFLRPHLKFRMENEKRNKDLAIPTAALDDYLIDMGKSFFLFFLLIGPVAYKTYIKKENIFESSEDQQANSVHKIEDKTATLLKNMMA